MVVNRSLDKQAAKKKFRRYIAPPSQRQLQLGASTMSKIKTVEAKSSLKPSLKNVNYHKFNLSFIVE